MIPRLQPRRRPLPAPRNDRVALTVTIDTLDALNLRLALHRALGERIGVHVLSVDGAGARCALQLQCGRGQLDALMHAVMSGLPRAEFGPVLAAPAYTAR